MTLDSWLVARLAVELERLLRGARVTGLRAHDRGLAVLCERRREACAFEVLLDPDRPLAAAVGGAAVTDESGPGGWAGGVAALLRGSVVDAVRAVPDDRILNVDLHSRSAFGVPAHHRLVVELEPRKSNAMIVRPAGDGAWSVLAAARRFAAQGTARSVAVGEPYEPPPPRVARIDRAAFLAAVRAVLTQPEHEARALVRLLNDFDPSCTPPLARRLVDELLSRPESLTGPPSEAGDSLLHAWQRLHDEVAAGAHDPAAPVFVYHQGDQVSACHVVTLPWANGVLSRAPALNDVCAAEIERRRRARSAPAGAALRKKLERALERCGAEMQGLREAQDRAEQAHGLRASGDLIYANLASIPDGAAVYIAPDGTRIALDPLLSAKQNAADYFRRYKKARSGLPRIGERLARLAQLKPYWEHLLWELDRADADPSLRAAIYDDVSAAFARPSRGRPTAAPRKPARPQRERAPVELPGGALAYVGRSPKDNERLTFALARPNDWWFHARGIPGAHVILKLPHAGEAPSREQIARAAALAAGASRAADAGKVEVDYTQRKHVRRQGKGATGLVWYTDFKTVLAAPAR